MIIVLNSEFNGMEQLWEWYHDFLKWDAITLLLIPTLVFVLLVYTDNLLVLIILSRISYREFLCRLHVEWLILEENFQYPKKLSDAGTILGNYVSMIISYNNGG